MAKMKVIEDARKRRELANNPGVSPSMRSYVKQLNAKVSWGPTSTTTTTTTTTITTFTTTTTTTTSTTSTTTTT